MNRRLSVKEAAAKARETVGKHVEAVTNCTAEAERAQAAADKARRDADTLESEVQSHEAKITEFETALAAANKDGDTNLADSTRASLEAQRGEAERTRQRAAQASPAASVALCWRCSTKAKPSSSIKQSRTCVRGCCVQHSKPSGSRVRPWRMAR